VGGEPAPARVGDALAVAQQQVGGGAQRVEGLHQDRHLPEREQAPRRQLALHALGVLDAQHPVQ
jgi:hypothetical protein